MRITTKKTQSGFTIIELMIATVVFSVVLLVFLSAFIKISELFYKGVNMSRTQEIARDVLNNISNDVQFYRQTPYTAQIKNGWFCIGDHRYAFNLHSQVGSSGTYGIAKQLVTGCPGPGTFTVPSTCNGTDASNCQELLDDGMEINGLSLKCLEGFCNVSINVIFYGSDKSVLYSPGGDPLGPDAADAQCKGVLIDSQYCATATYQSTILQSF